MATPYDTLNASNGNGEAVRATVTTVRAISSTIINVDSVTNWPAKFIATTAKLNVDGTLDPTTIQVFSGELVGVTIQIDSFAPGYTDKGNSAGDIVVIKPTTFWADQVAAAAQSMSTFTQTQGDWRVLAPVPTLNASNGQREYQLKFANTDLTTTLQPGTKLKIPRTSTPPTQSMSFTAASSQYATKASPAGITFTSAFTCEAWVYLNSYADVAISSKFDGTNGWRFASNSSGQLYVQYTTASTNHLWNTYQSLPLNRWIHVAVTVSTGGPTVNTYIDGVSVPNAQTTNTGAQTINQGTGPLQIGAFNGANFFNGYIAEARVWSVAQTQANILNNMNISLLGSETNLVALFQGNGNFNDKTANANTLTATNGAIATNASVPQNATEYAIATKVAKSGSDTLVTVFLPTGTGLPNETLGTASYSVARTPYGFPSDKPRWTAGLQFKVQTSLALSNATGSPLGGQFILPTGVWKLSKRGMEQVTAAATNFLAMNSGLSTSSSSFSQDLQTTVSVISSGSVTAGEVDTYVNVSQDYAVSSQTTLYLVFKTLNTSAITYYNGSTPQAYVIEAECAYL